MFIFFHSSNTPNAKLEEIAESKSEENIATITINPKKKTTIESTIENVNGSNKKDSTTNKSDSNEAMTASSADANVQPDFLNEKEKQCWDLFCKMSEKGVNVTFDTILRGMLTPTEYRMRRKPSLVEDENGDASQTDAANTVATTTATTTTTTTTSSAMAVTTNTSSNSKEIKT